MIQYIKRKKTNPVTEKTKYYAQIAPVLPVTQDELANYINDQTTVSKTDIKAILVALDNAFIHYLSLGLSVRLGEVGSFRPTISSDGEETEEAVTAKDIRAVRVRFTMGSELRKAFDINSLSFSAYKIPSTDNSSEE